PAFASSLQIYRSSPAGACATPGGCVSFHLQRVGVRFLGGGQDSQLRKGEGGDVGEHGRGNRAPIEAAGGAVDHHADRELGVLGRDHPHEGGGVIVEFSARIGDLGGSGLPRDPVPLDGGVVHGARVARHDGFVLA